MKKYSKFIVAILAALGVLGVALQDWNVTADEGWQIAITFLGALGVYQVRNKQ